MELSHTCPACELRLTDVVTAMRHHHAVASQALTLARSGGATEEQKHDSASAIVATFDDAQLAWDAYREHLIGHGFLLSLAPRAPTG